MYQEEGCEWPNSKTRSRVRDVEEENERLRSRIHELENPSMPSVFLHDPNALRHESPRSSQHADRSCSYSYISFLSSSNTCEIAGSPEHIESTLQNLTPGVIKAL
jgi:hypothetical protein